MAMFKFKKFLLEKGEKIVLGVALVGFGLFGVMGISRFVSAESPKTKSDDFKNKASEIQKKVARAEGDPGVPPPPKWVEETGTLRIVNAENFRSPFLPFETVDTPS